MRGGCKGQRELTLVITAVALGDISLVDGEAEGWGEWEGIRVMSAGIEYQR